MALQSWKVNILKSRFLICPAEVMRRIAKVEAHVDVFLGNKPVVQLSVVYPQFPEEKDVPLKQRMSYRVSFYSVLHPGMP